MTYKVNLAGRNEAVEYNDQNNTYIFDAFLHKKEWELNLLCSKNGIGHNLTDEESKIILPRIIKFLENIKWFFVFGGGYTVRTVRREPLTLEDIANQEREDGNTVIDNEDGTITVVPKKRKSFWGWLFK